MTKQAWTIWWKDTAKDKPQKVIITGNIFDAMAEKGKHEDAYESGMFTVEVPDDE